MYAKRRAYGFNIIDAYRSAYMPKPGTSIDGQYANAQKVEASEVVQYQIKEFKIEIELVASLTPGRAMEELREHYHKAMEDKKYTAAKGVYELMMKLSGLLIERHHHIHEDMSEREIMEMLSEMAKEHPNMAGELESMLAAHKRGERIHVEALSLPVPPPGS